GMEVDVPHLLQQVASSHDLAGVEQEVLEELQLARGETELDVAHERATREAVHHDVGESELLGTRGAAATNERADARPQLVGVHWFAHVAIRAGVERANDVGG